MDTAVSQPALPDAPPRAGRRPELLAPAGDWECVHAAVENGADAIYFGLERFNARMRAKNFTQADLPALMEFLHRRGVRGYVTFNTLIFTPELADAADYVRTIVAAGADAAIVQDVGACRLIRGISPDFPIHCSTQMTITSAAGVEFARQLGAQLVVLALFAYYVRSVRTASPLGKDDPFLTGLSHLPTAMTLRLCSVMNDTIFARPAAFCSSLPTTYNTSWASSLPNSSRAASLQPFL